jgi:hypothetical protein
MNNKRITGLRLGSILVIFGITTGLLTSLSSEVVSASSVGPSGGPNQEAIDHISEAKIAIQNGDTEGTQRHLDLAHQALGCGPPEC